VYIWRTQGTAAPPSTHPTGSGGILHRAPRRARRRRMRRRACYLELRGGAYQTVAAGSMHMFKVPYAITLFVLVSATFMTPTLATQKSTQTGATSSQSKQSGMF
jgi:hypothetical protein